MNQLKNCQKETTKVNQDKFKPKVSFKATYTVRGHGGNLPLHGRLGQAGAHGRVQAADAPQVAGQLVCEHGSGMGSSVEFVLFDV